MGVLQTATKLQPKRKMNATTTTAATALKATAAGHWSNPTGGRMLPVILIFRGHRNNAMFTFGGDKRQRGRALRRARALA